MDSENEYLAPMEEADALVIRLEARLAEIDEERRAFAIEVPSEFEEITNRTGHMGSTSRLRAGGLCRGSSVR
jgi:hypothetical protein